MKRKTYTKPRLEYFDLPDLMASIPSSPLHISQGSGPTPDEGDSKGYDGYDDKPIDWSD